MERSLFEVYRSVGKVFKKTVPSTSINSTSGNVANKLWNLLDVLLGMVIAMLEL